MEPEDEAYKGRRPSFNSRGQVRGFRSRPGAPMADPTQNIGAIGTMPSSMTTQSNWDRMFRNSVTGETPSSMAAARAGAEDDLDIMDEMPAFVNAFRGNPPPPPDLTQMAGGGSKSQARWSGKTSRNLGGGWQTGNAMNILDKYQTKGTVAKSPFGWSSAFATNG